jgi:hypothetical protein
MWPEIRVLASVDAKRVYAGFLFTVPKRGKVHGTEYEDLAHVGERVDELGLRLGDEAGELLIRACVSEL